MALIDETKQLNQGLPCSTKKDTYVQVSTGLPRCPSVICRDHLGPLQVSHTQNPVQTWSQNHARTKKAAPIYKGLVLPSNQELDCGSEPGLWDTKGALFHGPSPGLPLRRSRILQANAPQGCVFLRGYPLGWVFHGKKRRIPWKND